MKDCEFAFVQVAAGRTVSIAAQLAGQRQGSVHMQLQPIRQQLRHPRLKLFKIGVHSMCMRNQGARMHPDLLQLNRLIHVVA